MAHFRQPGIEIGGYTLQHQMADHIICEIGNQPPVSQVDVSPGS